jgi:hypothetical protein
MCVRDLISSGFVMIEVIEGLPDNVLGIVVRGRLTKHDCSEVLFPELDQRLEWYHKLRLYYDIRSRYPGAGWEAISPAIVRGALWERIAIVSDIAWMRHTVQAVRMLIPSEVRVFATSETPDGLAWIVGAAAARQRPATMPRTATPGGMRPFVPARQFLHQGP